MVEYPHLAVRYKASYVKPQLFVEEVTPQIYLRIGTEDSAETKLGAVELLKLRLMEKFLDAMQAIDWQAIKYVK